MRAQCAVIAVLAVTLIYLILKKWTNPVRGFIQLSVFTAGEFAFVCNRGIACENCLLSFGVCPIGVVQRLAFITHPPFYITLIVIAGVGVIFGTLLCGWVCPVGFIQDLLSVVRMKQITISRKFASARYLVLAGVAALVIFEGVAGVLSKRGLGIFSEATIIAGMVILSVAVFSKRFFCRFVCPLGVILGFSNRFSLVKVDLSRRNCSNCGRCGDHACVAGLIPKDGVNSALCVKCFECKKNCVGSS